MVRIEKFFEKILTNEGIVSCLENLEESKWKQLHFGEKIKLFRTLFDRINDMYPELGRCNFDFAMMDELFDGEANDESVVININALDEDDRFDVLVTCMHELRHFYQKQACKLYEKTGYVHEMFTKEELEAFSTNNVFSPLNLVTNYIEGGGVNSLEYKLQPIEYDAENFAQEFLKLLAKRFLKSKQDMKDCAFCSEEFNRIKRMYVSSENDLIDFGKIHSYYYEDKVKDNQAFIKCEKQIYDKCMKLLDNIDNLNEHQIFMLLNYCFWKNYDDETRVKLLNAYLKVNESNFQIVEEDGYYYLDDIEVNIHEEDVFVVVEDLFLKIAEQKIKEICDKDFKDLKKGYEKEVKLNLVIDENVIKKEDNPLYYEMQPYIIFRNLFMKNEYYKLVRGIDEIYDSTYNYLVDFRGFIKKYDSQSIRRKVEILTGKKFEDVYKEMIAKMQSNLKKKRATKK